MKARCTVQSAYRNPLKGIGVQIVNLRNSEPGVVLSPDFDAFVILLDEGYLPIPNANREVVSVSLR